MIMRLQAHSDWKAVMEGMGVDPSGVAIMQRKAHLYHLLIRDLPSPAANILKQDALSIGAELAVPYWVADCSRPTADVLLIANEKQLRLLTKKEAAQPFGLKQVAKELHDFLVPPANKSVRLMGILNINADSFVAASRTAVEEIVARAEVMIAEGADIIDIGAVSSRPGSLYPGVEEEMRRLEPVVKALHDAGIHEKVTLSLDSYEPAPLRLALAHGFSLINDITGGANPEVVALAAEYDAEYLLMHMQGTPETMQKAPIYEDLFGEIEAFFGTRIAQAEAAGVKQIILDVGIGFGKTTEHNLRLLKHLGHFHRFGRPLLVGASRKSLIGSLTGAAVEERLSGTLALHQWALQEGAAILRVHDVAAHRQMITMWQALQKS